VDGIAGQSGYGSGKAGIIGLTKVLAKEWGRYNVNVNAVGFGLIETRLVAPATTANAVLFFCSPLSDYVTGEVLICGGGLHF
jgi:3-oxoacyl-[acyl-carrier protein] reductase